jgi:nucleotide-binding universal stress UspA family protein
MALRQLRSDAMYTRILVPIDGSATSDRGLREAIAIAAPGSTLVLLNVISVQPLMLQMEAALHYDEVLAGLRDDAQRLLAGAARMAIDAGLRAESVLREVKNEHVGDVIVDEARTRRCELIVMGTHGRRGLERLAYGSDAALVLRHAPVPVLVVRRAEDASISAAPPPP